MLASTLLPLPSSHFKAHRSLLFSLCRLLSSIHLFYKKGKSLSSSKGLALLCLKNFLCSFPLLHAANVKGYFGLKFWASHSLHYPQLEGEFSPPGHGSDRGTANACVCAQRRWLLVVLCVCEPKPLDLGRSLNIQAWKISHFKKCLVADFLLTSKRNLFFLLCTFQIISRTAVPKSLDRGP